MECHQLSLICITYWLVFNRVRYTRYTIILLLFVQLSSELKAHFPKLGLATYDMGDKDGVVFRFDPTVSFPGNIIIIIFYNVYTVYVVYFMRQLFQLLKFYVILI